MKLLKKKKNLIKLEKIFFKVKKKKYNKKFILFEILDSIEILEFISIVEKTFKIKFGTEKINEKNFETLNTVDELIANNEK